MENLRNLVFDESPISGVSDIKPQHQDVDPKDPNTDFSFGRLPLEEIQTNSGTTKQKLFSEPPYETGLVTPPPSLPSRLATEAAPTPKTSEVPHLLDILLWVNPVKSTLYLLAGVAVLSLWAYAVNGEQPITLTSGLAYFLLLDLSFNVLRSLLSTKWQESSKWAQSSWIPWFTSTAEYCAHQYAVLHDTYLSASRPDLTLKVAGFLWVLAVLGSRISALAVATITLVAAFTVPVAYQRYRAQVDAAAKQAFNVVVDQCTAMKITRAGMAALFTLPFAIVWFTCGWSAVLMAMLVYIIALRCLLQPAEVDAIRTAAEPYTQSVRKAGAHLSGMAGDFINSYTPTPPRTKAHVN